MQGIVSRSWDRLSEAVRRTFPFHFVRGCFPNLAPTGSILRSSWLAALLIRALVDSMPSGTGKLPCVSQVWWAWGGQQVESGQIPHAFFLRATNYSKRIREGFFFLLKVFKITIIFLETFSEWTGMLAGVWQAESFRSTWAQLFPSFHLSDEENDDHVLKSTDHFWCTLEIWAKHRKLACSRTLPRGKGLQAATCVTHFCLK